MHIRTLALVTAGTLILGGGSSRTDAGFTGVELHLHAQFEADETSWSVWRSYATFNNPADSLNTISGNPSHPLEIKIACGPFFESPFGNVNEHNAQFDPLIENIEFDSYVTIGSTDTGSAPPTSTQGMAGNWSGNALVLTNGGWFRNPSDAATAQVATPGGNSGVLFGQFTFPSESEGFQGIMRLGGIIDGQAVTLPLVNFGTLGFETCCRFDVNNDLEVDVDDLVEVILAWGHTTFTNADVNSDGIVDVDDLIAVILHWGPTEFGFCATTP